jgi:hypothetical protein
MIYMGYENQAASDSVPLRYTACLLDCEAQARNQNPEYTTNRSHTAIDSTGEPGLIPLTYKS